jgi:uncharacterized lipoprotein YbaY
MALPKTAVLTVRLVDVSRQDASSTTLVEQRIETEGKQVPFSFDLVYEQVKIQDRNRYAVQAEIRDNGRLLYITDVSYPVLTQGNPKTVDIVVVPVRGGGQGQGQSDNSRTLRGTVTYRQRSALPSNSNINVRLVDLANPGTAVAETTFSSSNRQVPIPFELSFEQNLVNGQRSYGLEAEITSADGKTAFKTETPVAVQVRGNQANNQTELVLVQGITAITGKTISLSKFGTGSMKIGTTNQFLIRGTVTVDTEGEANVTLNRIDGGVTFSGKLTYFDDTTLRITVGNSGDADASGEIEIKYSGRRLGLITGSSLVLDSQNVTLRF